MTWRNVRPRLGGAVAFVGDMVSLVWPRTCAGCGRPCDGPVCETCRGSVSPRDARRDCAVCGKTILATDGAAGTAAPVCAKCRAKRPAFDAARSAVDYSGPVREIVMSLKYRGARDAARWMADWMLGCVVANWPGERFDAVVPVPLFPGREAKRGYNQAALLAEAVASGLGDPVAARLLVRLRDTGTQTRLGAAKRRGNVAGAFAVRAGRESEAYGKRLLLVDDVMTTGSTLDAASAALRAAGAGRVLALSFARG